MSSRPTCATCRWFDPQPGKAEGSCRRFPPLTPHPVWLAVRAEDWCGEHGARGGTT